MGDLLPLLAAFLLDWNDPADLVRDLADDSIRVRERAAGELYRRGETLRGFLREAEEGLADLEIRARLKDTLRRLDADERIRWFGGGNRIGGFGAALRSDRFSGSGPFRLTLEIMNLSARDQEFPGLGSWDVDLPDQEIRSTGAEARVGVRKFIGAGGLRRTSYRSGDGVPRTPVLLRPGESARFEVVVEARSLPPGDYLVGIEYFAPDLIPGAEENLKSNTVQLMIRR